MSEKGLRIGKSVKKCEKSVKMGYDFDDWLVGWLGIDLIGLS